MLDGNVERSALVAEALRLSGRLRLQVHGESMLPALWPGDVVEIASCSLEDLRPGEIVLARRDGRLFLHRLVSTRKPDGFLLRGDSMPGSDPQFPAEALLGRLVSKAGETRGVSPFQREMVARAGNGALSLWRGPASCSETSQPPASIGARISKPGTGDGAGSR